MKKLVILITLAFCVSVSHAQEKKKLGILGKGLLNLFDYGVLRNPNALKNMSESEYRGANFLFNTLRDIEQRNYDWNSNNRTFKITLENGQKADIYKGYDGSYSLQYANQKYPIANQLMLEVAEKNALLSANEIGRLPNYDWGLVSREFYARKKDTSYIYALRYNQRPREIASNLGISLNNILLRYVRNLDGRCCYLQGGEDFSPNQGLSYYLRTGYHFLPNNCNSFIKKDNYLEKYDRKNPCGIRRQYGKIPGSPWPVEILIAYSFYPVKQNFFLTYKWFEDINGNNKFDPDEFKGISRSFYGDEEFFIIVGYQSQKTPTKLYLEIRSQYGEVLQTFPPKEFYSQVSAFPFSVHAGTLSPGRYYLFFKVKNSRGGQFLSGSEEIEILPAARF